ncbi:MAG: hypothetical protein Q8Q11_00660 [bacterium]|nr:hypothetical protein [bacterium]MDZ4247826.1 hypothetical protein [Patescibacteria group bacterium]
MPHRTVFQWGKNHAHPFTTFVGGFIVGGLVVGAVLYAWQIADETADVEIEDAVVVPVEESTASPEATVEPSPEATAAAEVQF